MPHSFVIDSSKFFLTVKVIGGFGDGPLIWIDAQGHIHVGPDPRPVVNERLQVALKQLQVAANAVAEAAAIKA